ncbi:MAG: DNA polymerase III subunit alpha [Methylacidiphilales bacterium]|nr:DNA polymerase III subunit alpha [Candidatus Methylacidiphilales bacterium]
MRFAHLHTHSYYSLNEGKPGISHLVKKAKDIGVEALALTDTNLMTGIPEFISECKKNGIKGIIGAEFYVKRDDRPNQDIYRLILLAQNIRGYRNLMNISSIVGTQKASYYKYLPFSALKDLSDDLICITGGWDSEIGATLLSDDSQRMDHLLNDYLNIFKGRLYLDLRTHNHDNILQLNNMLYKLSSRYSVPCIFTSDVHYLEPGEQPHLKVIYSLQENWPIIDCYEEASTYERHMLEYYEVVNVLSKCFNLDTTTQIIDTTVDVVNKIEEIQFDRKFHLPSAPVDQRYIGKEDQFFKELVTLGFERRYGIPSEKDKKGWSHDNSPCLPWCFINLPAGITHPKQMQPRLPRNTSIDDLHRRLWHEIDTICSLNFHHYMLIVWDIIKFAHDHSIGWNVRGSAAGSIVSYALGLTRVEPVGHGLFFERFLNPQRVSMPDIDIDFPDDTRFMIINHTVERYSQDHVGGIIAIATLGAKAAIRAAGRLLEVPLEKVNYVCNLIYIRPGREVLIQNELKENKDLIELYNTDPQVHELIETALIIQGRPSHFSTHAAGIVIADRPLREYVPLYEMISNDAEKNLNHMTQYDMLRLEDVGLLKMDYLGLTMLRTIRNTCDLIRARHSISFDLDTLPYDDPKVYENLGKGDVVGIFQSEGEGFKQMLKKMKPQNFENIIAALSLFRPGPLQYLDSYINRLHKREKPFYRHPILEPILRETFGIMVYQEQVMGIAKDVGGFSLSEADILRKSISKKDRATMDTYRSRFIQGANQKNIPKDTANAIWADIERFADYGFNKAHAASFARLTCQSMWLKSYYTIEYMCSLLNSEMENVEKVGLILKDCLNHGIEVLPPNINTSKHEFCIVKHAEKEAIRVGLGAIKYVRSAGEEICAVRGDVPFKNCDEFVTRYKPNKRVLSALIMSGALSSLHDYDKYLNLEMGSEANHMDILLSRLRAQRELIGITLQVPDSLLTTLLQSRSSIRIRIEDVINEQNNIASFYVVALVASQEWRKSKNNNPYQTLTLIDDSGEMTCHRFVDTENKDINTGDIGKFKIIRKKVGERWYYNVVDYTPIRNISDSVQKHKSDNQDNSPQIRLFV